MKKEMIDRECCGFHFIVDPHSSSDIYFTKEELQKLNDDDCALSVTGISKYFRKNNPSYSPILLTWEMTSRCNFNCPFCYIKDNSIAKEVSFEETIDLIDTLADRGLFEVYLSGGECLLVEDFLKIYEHFKKRGVFVTVFTNGSLINNKVLECWKNYPPSSVEITLYTDDVSTPTFQNILKLREMGIYVLPKFTMTRTTEKYFEGVKRWIDDNHLELGIETNITDGIDELHSGIKEKYSLSVEQQKKYAPSKYENIKTPSRIRTAFSCQSKQGILQISPDFTMSLCNKMVKRWDLRSVDANTAINELSSLVDGYKDKTIHGCNGCEYSHKCDICYVNAEKIGGELYVPKGHCERLAKNCEKYL